MARSAAWVLLLCAIAAGVQAKTPPVAITRRHGQHQAPTPNSAASAPLQARSADLPVLGAVGNIIGGLLGGGTATPTPSPTPTPTPIPSAPAVAGLAPWLIEPAHRNCGTEPLDAIQRAVQALELAPFLEALLDNLTDAVGNTVGAVGSTVGGLLGGLGLGRRLASAGSVSINVYFTVNRIGALGDASGGDVPSTALNQQVAIMNQLMSNTPFTFVNAGVTRISNLSWWNVAAPGTPMNEMKAATRVGNYADLNIWTTAMQDSILGLTSLPYNTGGSGDKLDGMVLSPYTLPGQAYSQYNLGLSGVHELGHWLGLDHPFYSGCTEPNDVVTDTPEMANPQFDCVAVNSCPNRPSGQGTTDPIHNIMGYTPDACMTDPMTALQSIRMQAMWNAYRSTFSASGQAGAGTTKTVGPLAPSSQQTTGGLSPTTPAPVAAPQSTTTTAPQPSGGGGSGGSPVSASTPSAPSGGSGGASAPTPNAPAAGGSSGATPTSAPVEPTPVLGGGPSGTVNAAPTGGSPSVGTTSGGSTSSAGSPSSSGGSSSGSDSSSGSPGAVSSPAGGTPSTPVKAPVKAASQPAKPKPTPKPQPKAKAKAKPKPKPTKRKPVRKAPKRG